jgi:2,4-dienoyl-CoA reductase-like NADH-dependent reductase (Old Yellow Enzyme family)
MWPTIIRRAKDEVGLIVSEGTVVNRPASSNDPAIPHFYGEKPLSGWKAVIDGVHAAGGLMAPQLWHMGVVAPKDTGLPPAPFEGPSGYVSPGAGGHKRSMKGVPANWSASIKKRWPLFRNTSRS